MKVLWFEVTEPYGYNQREDFVCGWQDSLEKILSNQENTELFIAFESSVSNTPRKKKNVSYMPLYLPRTYSDEIKSWFSWTCNFKKLTAKMLDIINAIKPDVIHIFGTEWPYGLIAKYTAIPTVIHIQGSISEINKFIYPQNYSFLNEICANPSDKIFTIQSLLKPIKDKSRLCMEKKIWAVNSNYMGRTQWDEELSSRMSPNRNYFHVDEALRNEFYQASYRWTYKKKSCLTLITIGCAPLWKGPNILLKTSQILKRQHNLNFKWFAIGAMPPYLKKIIEKKEHTTFEENNVYFLGWQSAAQIKEILCNASFLIHCSYVDNSPNAICEAQYMGLPIISTCVGGIPSLIEDNKTGFLVPANNPQAIVNKIISLNKNETLLKNVSEASIIAAHTRHDKKNILNQLLNCYNTIINKNKNE